MTQAVIAPTFEDWRRAARSLLAAGAVPDTVEWIQAADAVGTFGTASEPKPQILADEPASDPRVTVPREFVGVAGRVARHGDQSRWGLLYRVLWRLVHEDRQLLQRDADPDVMVLRRLEREAAGTLEELKDAARHCTACPLYKNATQTVFGAGPAAARAMFVGEQPGDQEDLAGQPFVGPAGEVLTRALAEAGIPREDVYITNAVKHFKWEPRGKRRIHQTPRTPEIEACRPWIEAEIAMLKPAVLVCLGATAAQALIGPHVRIMRDRGTLFPSRLAPWLTVTVHPSSILRADPGAPQERAYADLVADLRKVAARLAEVRDG
jgi:uracil-DNA glycosylase family protein